MAVQVNSFAAHFETDRNSSSYAAVNSFFNTLTARHSFSTGGSNDHECWGPPLTMADAIEKVCLESSILLLATCCFAQYIRPEIARKQRCKQRKDMVTLDASVLNHFWNLWCAMKCSRHNAS